MPHLHSLHHNFPVQNMLPFNGQPIMNYPIKAPTPYQHQYHYSYKGLHARWYCVLTVHREIQAAVESGIFDLVMVSTDDEDIAEASLSHSEFQ